MRTDNSYEPFKKSLTLAFCTVSNADGMGAFILGLCCIDWMAAFYFARDSNRDDYKAFIKRFLPKYDADALWSDLRCGLVHNFTNRRNRIGYDFRENRPQYHLKLRPDKDNPKIKLKVINLSNFVNDLRIALHDFFAVLERNPEMKCRAIERYLQVGLIAGSRETV